MRVIGISAFYHDSAAALVEDGRVVAAAQEERFTRKKHDEAFPARALAWLLEREELRLSQIDHVVFYEKPFLKFERLLETYLGFAPRGFRSFRAAMPIWLRDKLFQKQQLAELLCELDPEFDWRARLLFGEHHGSHAASAFFPSPFAEAAVLTMDGVGEWATTTVGVGRGNRVELTRQIDFPHSLGMLYSAFTYWAGFKVNSGEYKLMGLAPYGEPRFATKIRERLIDLKPDGSFRLNLDYFDYATGLRMTNARFDALFGAPPRRPDEPLGQLHMDVAASIQHVTDEAVRNLVRFATRESGLDRLCLAGGVALNCVSNGRLLAEGLVRELWVQPAAGDAGGAVGAALHAYFALTQAQRQVEPPADGISGALLGPEFSDDEVERRLTALGAVLRVLPQQELLDEAAERLAAGAALGWFQGRMEFGPRALGARSILCDPRNPEAQKTLNLKVKFRESFRPFAPAVLAEHARDWFELDAASPYMLVVADVAPARRVPLDAAAERARGLEKLGVVRSTIPAVTHVDGSARIQTVGPEAEPRFRALLQRFHALTGCPVLVNTSFNVRGEPIVCTPEDAYRCFMGTRLDALVIGRALLEKSDQPAAQRSDYAAGFEPD